MVAYILGTQLEGVAIFTWLDISVADLDKLTWLAGYLQVGSRSTQDSQHLQVQPLDELTDTPSSGVPPLLSFSLPSTSRDDDQVSELLVYVHFSGQRREDQSKHCLMTLVLPPT